MDYYMGIDGGSTYVKAAIIQKDKVIATKIAPTGIDNPGTAKRLFDKMTADNGIDRKDVRYIMATGYSRKIIDIADDDVSEITAHACGVKLTAPRDYKPGLRT